MYFGKFIDDIVGKFYSNSRYTNSIFRTLKIFFEKNTKHFNAVDKLGNVYRSSKWVDLKLRNLNATSLFRLIFFVFFLLLLVLLATKLSGSLVITLLTSPARGICYLIDFLYYSWLIIVALVYSMIAKAKRGLFYCFLKSLTFKNRLRPQQSAHSDQAPSYKVVLPLSAKDRGSYNNLVLPGVVHFYRLHNSVILLGRSFFGLKGLLPSSSAFFEMALGSPYSPFRATFNSLNIYKDVVSFIEDPKYVVPLTVPYITDLEDLYTPDSTGGAQKIFKLVYSFSPSQSTCALFTFSVERSTLSNVTTNLTLGKENR